MLTMLFSLISNAYGELFSGQVEGNVFTMVNVHEFDINGNPVLPSAPNVQLFIVGMKVELLKKDAFADTVIAEGVTGELGAFHLEFATTDSASKIELYLKFIAENGDASINEDPSIRVLKKLATSKVTRSETFRKSNPIIAQAGIRVSENFDAIELDNEETKPQLLHWANRSKQLVESESSFSFPAGQDGRLDILAMPLGAQTSFFFPGGFQTELIAFLIDLHSASTTAVAAIFPELGLILAQVGVLVDTAITTYVNTQFSDQDAIYISDNGQLNENTIYHEFGHFLMWHLQDESWLNPLDASFSRHFEFANAPNSKLAWTEGFPNGFSMIVDSWSRLDDGEYGFDGIDEYEDRSLRTLEDSLRIIDCTTGGSTCNGQVLSHGYVSEWYVGTTLYDLWDGAENLQLIAPPVTPEEHEDPVVDNSVTPPVTTINDQVGLSFADIIQPLRNNQGTGGFHHLLNNQEQFLINDFVQYHEELLALTFPLIPGKNEKCRLGREITDLFHYNGIRNLHNSLDTAKFPDLLSADFLNTDILYFDRDVETEFYILDNNQTFVRESTVFQPFSVDVTELVDSNDSFNYSSTAANDFNGVLSDDLRVSGTVTAGSAVLSFNNSGFYGWQSVSNNYNMPLSAIPVFEDEFNVSLCGGMTLEINDGGSVVVGDAITTHSSQVTLESGGEFILGGHNKSKGRLVINANSRFVVERDATLRINPGAEILLIGANAVLEIRGNLVISAGAEFSYTSSGGGYVLFDLPDNDGMPNVVMDATASIMLDEVPFKVAENSYIRPDDIAGPLFTIRNFATGYFRDNAYIDVSQSYFTLDNATIKLDDGASSHKGVILNGAGHLITNSMVSGGDPGIYDSNKSGNVPLAIDTTQFFNCGTAVEAVDLDVNLRKVRISTSKTGLKTVRGSAELLRTELLSNDTGWWAIQHSQQSSMRGGSASGNHEYGLRIEAQFGSELSLKKVDFLKNQVGMWVDGAGSVTPKKSRFNFNSRSGMLLSGGALLDMNKNAGNVFSHNPVSVELEGAGVPVLLNGHNNFYPFSLTDDGLAFSGTIANDLNCSDPLFNPNISAGGNNWHTSFNPVPVIGLANGPYDITSSLGCVYILIP